MNRLALVTGSTGFVGRALVGELRRRGWAVRGAARRRAEHDGETVAVGDLDPTTDWSAALRDVDTVFHLAARVHAVGEAPEERTYQRVNSAATAALAQAAAAAGARRFVFVSSVKVMGEVSPARPFDEADPPQPQDAYGRSKLAAEGELAALAARLAVTIIRPPLVYGPGVRANFLRLLRLAAGGWPLPLASARAPRSLVYVGNLVDALIAAATAPHASPATYFVADGRDVSVAELVALLRAEMRLPPRLWPLPAALVRTAARSIGRADAAQRLFEPLQVNSSRIRRELGWTPPAALEDGLRATVRWFIDARARGEL